MTQNDPRLIKNGTGGPLKTGGSFTPEQIEMILASELGLMTEAIESVDGWATMEASQLAQELLDIGAHAPMDTSKIVRIWS